MFEPENPGSEYILVTVQSLISQYFLSLSFCSLIE